ncbi:unnamed protein product [marine sediment metagenome]|uniref:Methyltransferase domain-containing protein n=1 Tax=marine sediment metagenome TaxID=412755 RepID=X1B244_9ZZZZ
MKKNEMDTIYKTVPLAEIPWNRETPPGALVELVESGKVPPCKAIDLGCGAGNYAIYLTKKGFKVTGVDVSPTAIKIARENAKKQGSNCNFIALNVLTDLKRINESFEFAYDWQLLHHIFPKDRENYIKSVHGLLTPGGKYLSVCFSEKDSYFDDTGKYRKTNLGTTLYFSSENELRKLFTPYFTVIELKTIETGDKSSPHFVNYAFMEKR